MGTIKANSVVKKTKSAGVAGDPPAAVTGVPVPVPPLFRRVDWLTLGITFLVMWTAYFLTISPEVTLQDSGELAVGSFYAGVPHPPGYPVWTLYTWLWTVLLPVGNTAWQVAVGEVTAGALASALLAFLVSRGSSMLIEGIEELRAIAGQWENAICVVSGFVAGTLMGFNGFVWSQAVIVEVYLFGVLSFMLVLLCLMRWLYAPEQLRYAYLALFMFGICFTNHQSLIVAAIGIEVLLAARNPRLGRDVFLGNGVIYLFYMTVLLLTGQHLFHNIGSNSGLQLIFHTVGVGSLLAGGWLAIKTQSILTEWKAVVIMGALWLLGAAFYFYMPLAGMTNPPMQWGYPRTVEGFFHALTRGQYEQPNPTNVLSDPGRFIMQLKMLVEGIAEEFNWLYTVIALVPFLFFFKMKKREQAWLVGIVAIFLCLGVLLMILLNPSPERASIDLVKVFFTASHTLVALLVGYGITLIAAYMATHYQDFRRWGLIGGAVAVALALYCFVSQIGSVYFGDAGGATLSQITDLVGRCFTNKDQFGLPVFAGLLLIGLTLAFIAGLLLYRSRAPLALTLAIFAATPTYSVLCHWYDNEQRNHWFGYWFGHDMFMSPFNGADGKPLYPEMTKDAVLFGGTDPGRFCPTYMIFNESFTPHNQQPEQDQTFDRRDVYIITQNALADGTYLNYIRAHYNRSEQIDPPFFSELVRSQKAREEERPTLLSSMVKPLDRFFTGLGAQIEKKRRAGSSYFRESDFVKLPEFAAKLRGGGSPATLSQYLFQNLSQATQELVKNAPAAGPSVIVEDTGKKTAAPAKTPASEGPLRKALARELTALLQRDLNDWVQIKDLNARKADIEEAISLSGASDSQQRKLAEIQQRIAELSKTEPFYTPARFAGVELSDYLKRFIAQNPQSWTRIRLNRLLLEAAYSQNIVPSHGGVYPDQEIYIPTPKDSQDCFQNYLKDAEKRVQHDNDPRLRGEPRQIRPGEDVRIVNDGGAQRVQVSGQIAVMAINGLLTKVIFERNPQNEFYVEESFPLDWMFPYLTPFCDIMKINREIIPEITEDIVRRDHEFWKQYSKRLCGDIVDYDTPVSNIVAYIQKTFQQRDFSGFTGDRKFVRDGDAQKAFSKLRSSSAGIYAWRIGMLAGVPTPPQYLPKTEAERNRLVRETDFALKQAFAFCPYSPEAVFRYVQFLASYNRIEDAILIADTCHQIDPNNGQVQSLVNSLKGARGQQAAMHQAQGNLQKMEADWRANTSDLQAGFNLAATYLSLQQTNNALQVFDQVIASPKADVNAVLMVAQLLVGMGRVDKLESVLERLVQISPEQAEAWYDLAALKATLNKASEALPPLKKAIEISNLRRTTNTTARDLRAEVNGDARFNRLRDLPEFISLAAPK
jgi:tetratricopeptide (TPR) repeat protein